METDIETIRVSEPREVLAYIPHRLGFRPRDSAVLISLRPPRGAVGLIMRVDLPDLLDPEAGPQLARSAITTLDTDGARRVMCVLYTDGPDPRRRPSPLHVAARHVQDAAAGPFGPVDVLVVTPDGYLELGCDDDACCPAGGRPLRELESTLVGAHMVLAGSAVAGSREDLVPVERAPDQARRSVSRVRRRWEARCLEAWAAGPDAVGDWRAASVAAWRAAVASVESTPAGRAAPWGRLEAGLADRRVRDAVLVSLVPGTGDLAERCVRGIGPDPADDAAMGAALRRIMDADEGIAPPLARCRTHEQTLQAVVAHGRTGHQAPAWTLLAVLSWWRGDGARTQILLDRALADDPDYRLARMLVDLLAAAVGPGWTRRRAA
ncbi:DUF4192 domain-containing protein [Cellulomonas sp. PhB150]|uniref:DUF4192 domain-containing protein n=1 Tax=Cellulomonas sp. PhB150 TaxID=2485188 RepID=UPI000F4658DB|nr:DUF4192 domain-containing protein [Cellulomonas sp. PhB150]ROS30887.1 uncharacterized protein DUF4192 [Cellulomonas sp. PhB150]